MTKRKGGKRRKSRSKMTKPTTERGKISITNYLAVFKVGEKVQLFCEPGVHTGMYPIDFHARPGVIAGKSGSCYIVKMFDANKEKTLIVHPVHLRRQK